MNITRSVLVALAVVWTGAGVPGASKPAPACPAGVDPTGSASLAQMTIVPATQTCVAGESHGYSIPDPHCTPGAVNPTVTLSVLQDPTFRTACERDKTSSAARKATTYQTYGVPHPAHNQGTTQTCELDHLVSLELGGADSLDNIWPQCGPPSVPLNARHFKQKDTVENYLAAMVKAGTLDMATAQQGIATDWTQYLEAARAWEAAGHP